MLSPIPTAYNGVKFRSRTEARWAVFFDKAGLAFRYEAEGYQTDAGFYLPDFELSEAAESTFFEVKPSSPTARELSFLAALARGSEGYVFVAHGPPEHGSVIWRVYASGRHEQWHFATDHRYLVSFLVEPASQQCLVIHKDAVPEALHSLGARRELDAAKQYKFPLFGEGAIDALRDRRDWRQRERQIMRERFGDAYERRIKRS